MYKSYVIIRIINYIIPITHYKDCKHLIHNGLYFEKQLNSDKFRL